jgi:hypothetical protein
MNVREAVEGAVRQLVDEHVPRAFRARALAYLPLVVDRITAAVETIRGDR